MTTTYQKLLNKIEAFCNAHLQIKKYKGEFKEQMPNFATLDEKYPIVFVVPTGDTEGLELNQFTIEVYCLDIIQKDRANINTIVSDCHLILKDLYLYFKDGTDLEVDVIGDPTMTPLNNDLLDYAAGWVMTITFEVEGYTVCAIPMNPIPPFTPICEDASYLVEYVNGTPIESGTIPSGGSAIIQVPDPSVCDDAIVNINSVFWDNVPSGATENIIVRQSSGSTQVGSIQGQYFRIADSTAVVKNSVNTVISTTLIKAEDSEDIILPDETITITDELGNPLDVITFPVYSTLNIDIDSYCTPCPPAVTRSTATLMKTGQTTVYRTGDDADTSSEGRPTDFLTLDAAPLHNDGTATINTTTARFTDTLGGSTYADNIVLDWSTWNGSTLLGWRISENGVNIIWDNAIDEALTLNIGGFASGWRVPNTFEMLSICDTASSTRFLNYAPFNNSSNHWFWTSSTTPITTNNAMAVANQHGNGIRSRTKTTLVPSRYIPVRTFSLSTLNVLS